MIIQLHTPEGMVGVDSETVTDDELAALGLTRESFNELLPKPKQILSVEEHDALLGLLEGGNSITPVKDIRIALEILIEAIIKYDRKGS